jgi:hypothetical protein
MAWSEWVDVRRLQETTKVILAILQHAIAATIALLSFWLVAWLAKRAIPSGWVHNFLDYAEQFGLVVISLALLVHLVYDLLPERIRNAWPHRLVLA